jgi:uncharacterized repeat protein (TIGR01451 family)
MIGNWINSICSYLSDLPVGEVVGIPNGIRHGCDASAPQPVAVLCPAATTNSLLKSIFITLLLVVLTSSYSNAAQSGSQFVNRAELHTAELPTQISTVAVTLQQERTRSTIVFLKYAPGTPEAVATSVPDTYYKDASGSYLLLDPPVAVGSGTAIDLSSPVPLQITTLFHSGEPIFIRVTDLDQNLDRTVAETIIITITDPLTGDLETLRLTESGSDSGVFIGYIQSSPASTVTANGALSVVNASSISAHYIDPIDGSDSSTAAALVDPYGLVFDTTTGKPVDGAKVELLNADGTPATVYGDNGQANNLFPNSVISGGTAYDAAGNIYSFTPGGYRFPYINPGNYLIKVTPPSSYTAPSTVSTTAIQALPGAPFAIKDPGSREQVFTVPLGPAIRIDLPIDPATGTLWLSKSASRAIVSAGEFLSYSLTLENRDPTGIVRSPVIVDKLPPGFRYQKGSARINEFSLPDPAISPDGSTMTFSLSAVPPATTMIIRYVVAVGSGAKTGEAVNTAVATAADSVQSLQASATVLVREPFMTSRSLIMGRVFVGACSEDPEENKRGMEGIGIYLEDGTFVLSDQFGMFHFEGVKPGTHVVQLDLDSIPEGYKVLPCEQNSRFAGRAYSQFVDLQGGTMWRTDFYLGKNEPQAVPATTTDAPEVTSGEVGQTALPSPANETNPLPSQGTPSAKDISPMSAPVEAVVPAIPVAPSSSKAEEERVELISALNDGFINYRIKLSGFKQTPGNMTLTLVTPKSFLYIDGSSRLNSSPIKDPSTEEAVITYSFTDLAADKKLDLRLQAIIDGDDQTEALSSSVTVVTADEEGKPLKTLTAAAELSDNMDEFNRVDTPPSQVSPPAPVATPEIDNSVLYKETIQKNHLPEVAGSPGATSTQHVNEEAGILSLADGSVIATRINAVRIVLNSNLTPVMSIDGAVIPSDRIGFKMKDSESEKSLYTFIGVDFGDPGEHILQLKGVDPFGQTRFDKSIKVTLSGEITSIRLVSAEGNVADGRTPVKVRVQMFDKDNTPVMASAEISLKGGDLQPLTNTNKIGRDLSASMVAIGADGWISFQPVTNSGLYRAQLAYNNAVLDIETYVKPQMRDWILVGLAEGTVGYNTVSGNMENLKSSDQKEDLYSDERLALYAKGTIKGEWLLTMAYDTAKKSSGVGGSNSLFQTIDPESYYSIYADGSSQMYDASSQKKLYLRIERDQFYALFGDYNTGLTVTELSRYSRSMTGIKSEYRSRNFDVNAFGSETGQSFVKDEIRGDGTSGLYRLSRKGIILNSDKITIESRDRFHSEVITNSVQLSRFIDYSIDYDTGAIFFKSPIPSRDDQLNPVFIVVDYEIDNAGTEALTYGGRAAARVLKGRIEVGGTFVREGQVSGDNTLYGVDATAFITPGTKARVEVATTDNEVGVNQTGNSYYSSTTNDNADVKQKANAYLAEVVHTGKSFDARAYYKEQEQGFGLSQQSGSESGTRKFGVESGYRLNNKVTVNGQAYRQYNLADDSVRDFMEALAVYNEKQYTLRSGLRYANDSLQEGTDQKSLLATVGGSWRTLNQRLTLRADHDQALFNNNDSTDFPTRTIVGVDFQATKATTLFAQEELTFGATENTNTTRVGVKTTPWSGGTLNSAVVNDMRENSERTFANVGLTQRWQINPRWAVDGAVDHSETIRDKSGYTMNANVPPSSGGEDFTAVSLGANYTRKKITWSNRVEYRNSDIDDKWGLTSGLINEHGLDWAWTGRLQLYHTQSAGGNSSTEGDVRLGLVYRPPVTRWIVLNRLDLIGSDLKSETDTIKGRRIVNNLHANWKPDKKTQLSFQYGAKYVLEKIDDKEYSGYTDFMGLEGRYDINKEWDLGIRGSLLHTWELDQYAYSFGPSVGYNVMENAWISVGYNVAGFTDKDFSNANYTAQGPYIQYRFKFDQNSVKDGLKALNQ